MDETEALVQKNLVNFCKYLGEHVLEWQSALQETDRSIAAVQNQCEQLRHVEKVNLKHMEGFEEAQERLKYSILNGTEEELAAIRKSVEKLNKANQNLRNKLSTLEKSTVELSWDRATPLIKGSPTQPPLSRVLIEGLEFWSYFKKALDDVNANLKNFNVRSEKSMRALRKSLKIDLSEKIVTDLVAITQYVDNVKSIS